MSSEILSYLRRHGATTLKSLREQFQISQPTASRLLNKLKADILVIGKARETKYAAIRKIDDQAEFPIYEILQDGNTRHLGTLYPIFPQGFYFRSETPESTSALYADLPYFLNDVRPAGYLGRLIPLQNQDLQLPNDINLWTADHCLKYLSKRGWNIIGNFIIGDSAFQLYLANCRDPKHDVTINNRQIKYPIYANDILAMGDAGSSAGGEQPKFTTIILPENRHVIVKFSPPTTTDIGRRIADLLICEYIALQVLKKHGHDVSEAELITADHRIFLEVKRFDRVGKFSRLGVISLGSLDAEFSATANSWSAISTDLAQNKIISACLLNEIRFREIFGACIANNDMHAYNLSFITQGQRVINLSPIYDMTCMLFMPRNYQLIPVEFIPPLPQVKDKEILSRALPAALEFWQAVINDSRISPSFKMIANTCKQKITELQTLAALLPNNSDT